MSAVAGTSQAGSFTAGSGSTVSTLSGIEYILQTGPASSFSFTWTPPATNVGNVTINLAGVIGGGLYSNSYTITPASTPPPTSNTISVMPSSLTFNYAGGAAPAAQSFTASSSGSSINCTTSVATSSGGSWLSATASGGPTPLVASVSVNPAGLSAGTYKGSVTVTSTGASNSPQTVAVTLNVTATPPPSTPTLSLSTDSATFNSIGGTSVSPSKVQLTSSGSQLSFTTAVTTTMGGNWLSAGTMSGTTPATVSISANPSGLSNGTYQGKVTFTASGASNSPQTVNVTLTVNPATPPPTGNPGTLSFDFSALDKRSDGSDYMMLDGRGMTSNGQITGTGHFTQFTIGSDGEHQTVATGTWTAKSFVSYSAATTGSTSGGVLEINVELDPTGGTAETGSMRIADTGSDRGVKLTIDGGSTFNPTSTGSVSITGGTGGSCVSPTPRPPTRDE
jgi:hypothetical protein